MTQSPTDPDGDEASPSSGAEGIVSGEGPPCPLTGPETVLKFFGAKTVSFVAKTGPTGKPLCLFTVKGANVGGATGTVSMTVDSSSSAKAFAATQRAAKGAADLPGVGDTAFYVNDTGTAEFLKGNSAVIVQATFSLAAGTRYAATIRTDVVSVAKVVAAQI